MHSVSINLITPYLFKSILGESDAIKIWQQTRVSNKQIFIGDTRLTEANFVT